MASQGASSSSLSSSSILPSRLYDVFLSFRGKDTRDNFTAHLCNALRQKGIYTYMDDKLTGGEKISPALNKAIKESKIAIIILSENYASSTWCLDELKEIFECREKNQQIVLPVFYKVDPSNIRHQNKSFGEELTKHEGRFKDDIVQSWKTALNKVAALSGHHLEKGNESEFINGIVQLVSTMVSPTCLNVAKYPVGIESPLRDINVLLSIGIGDRRMVGIYGIGGIGKTTIAKAIYNSIYRQFEGSCFLPKVREKSKQEHGLVKLQKKLLYEILGDSSLKVCNVDQGINVIKERLCDKKVLLILDDVDSLIQLETLSGELDWFGLESRIIITTRDEHLLAIHKVDLKYKMNELYHNEALKLFSWYAFHSDKPKDDFVELTKHALHYVGGLPLALRVVGSNLYGRDSHHWKSELEKYKRVPHTKIHEILKISYDGLEESEKNIFLDIACFFKGEDVKYVTKILDSCGFFPDSGIEVLMDKSLITIDKYSGILDIHDLLQDMGREIVRQESPKDPSKRSRLWFHEDVRYVLEGNMGTHKIEGILVELPERDLICWSSNIFKKMKRLRYFISRNADFSKNPTYFPNELRVLDWTECRLQSLPTNFRGEKLTVLKMHNARFKEPKEGFKNFKNLSIIKFIRCNFISEIAEISGIPNLEKLLVYRCKSLVKVHDSVGFLDKLTVLSFFKCSKLISLPRSLKLRSLEILRLECCSMLQNFPEIECEMERLRKIRLESIAIKELPSSTVNFTGLSDLRLVNCKNLVHFPSSILHHGLHFLCVRDCSKLVMLPTKVRDERQSMLSIVSTEESEISSSTELFSSPPPVKSSIFDDGCSSIGFAAVAEMSLDKVDLFATFNFVSTLSGLNLSASKIVSLPAWFKRFVKLTTLELKECRQLQEILELPPNIKMLTATGCVSLERFPKVSEKNQLDTSEFSALECINFSECYKMAENIRNLVENSLRNKVHVKDSFGGGIMFSGDCIPDWFTRSENCSNSTSRRCAIDIYGFPHLDEIQGIVFCAVIRGGPELLDSSAYLMMKHKGMETSRSRILGYLKSDNVWLEYFVLESSELKGDILEFTFEVFPQLSIRSCGFHLIHKHEENSKDHPDVMDMNFYFGLDEPVKLSKIEEFYKNLLEKDDYQSSEASEDLEPLTEEDELDKYESDEESERTSDGIQPSKRRRDEDDDDDCNLESSCKKRFTTLHPFT